MEAIPLSDTSAAACAKTLTFSWISRFGVPETITSDRGPQFTSNLWFKLCEMLNISDRQTTAYHPESNGAVERLHSHLKDARATPTRRRGDLFRGVTQCTPRTLHTAEGRHWSFPA
jgi:transposase InsO family protein